MMAFTVLNVSKFDRLRVNRLAHSSFAGIGNFHTHIHLPHSYGKRFLLP
jgi:hypothetical protein